MLFGAVDRADLTGRRAVKPVEKLCPEGIKIVNHRFRNYPICKTDGAIQRMYWTERRLPQRVKRTPFPGGRMEHAVEKLLYSRRDAAEALSLSVRSVDYLITTGRLTCRKVGGKILIPAGAVRRFAREDHPEPVRSTQPAITIVPKKPPVSIRGVHGPQAQLCLNPAAKPNV